MDTQQRSEIQGSMSGNDLECAGVLGFSLPPAFRALHARSGSSGSQIWPSSEATHKVFLTVRLSSHPIILYSVLFYKRFFAFV